MFLSRHRAASGRPALCVHPIGIPSPQGEDAHGGRPGQCPPPAPRLAATYRLLKEEAAASGLEGYEITLEATHHGPWLEAPAMFLEIGSAEDQWDRCVAFGGRAPAIPSRKERAECQQDHHMRHWGGGGGGLNMGGEGGDFECTCVCGGGGSFVKETVSAGHCSLCRTQPFALLRSRGRKAPVVRPMKMCWSCASHMKTSPPHVSVGGGGVLRGLGH